MVKTVLQHIKQQRLVWSWSLIVGLLLVLVGHAPVFPVIAGCALAILMSTLRSASHGQPKPWQRGER
jgi:hypothetical protein